MAKRFKSLDELREYLKTHDKVFYWEVDKRGDMSKLGTPDYDPYYNLGYWISNIEIEWASSKHKNGYLIRAKRNDPLLPTREFWADWVFNPNHGFFLEQKIYSDIPEHFNGWLAFEDTSELEYARLTVQE